ncbi:MAG: hypothetical protein LBI55_03110 [Oscillospiraceae bacterium]|jgi:hypothetical protein|nr:hypothetical protein [Oscillospiraceae bacterium]
MIGDLKRFCLDLNENPDLLQEVNDLKKDYCEDFLSQEEAYDFVENCLIPFAESLGYRFDVRDYIEFESENQIHRSYQGLDFVSGGTNNASFSVLLDIPIFSFNDKSLFKGDSDF